MKKPIIGISQGDPNGVGLEVIMKTFQFEFMYEHCIPVLYGNPKSFTFHKKACNLDKLNYNLIKDVSEAKPNHFNLIATSNETVEIQFGKSTEQAGKEAFMAFKKLCEDAKANKLDAIVTAPLDKSNIKIAEGFTGHTGYLSQFFNVSDSLMILSSDELKIGLITEHVSLANVSEKLNANLISSKIKTANDSLKRDFGLLRPRIAVLGLNPHNGDNGAIGKEEKELIKPTITKLNDEKIQCYGPYSADGFFGTRNYKNFDLVMAMYHDQGLIPFKSIAFDDGINYTAGLPIIRTSPDHGTGYDIAGKNIASPLSFCNAVFAALDIYKQRNETDELRSNPLPYSELKRERFRLELN